MREKAREKGQANTKQSMGYPVNQEGLQTRVAKNDLQPVAGSRVFLEDGLKVGFKGAEHRRVPLVEHLVNHHLIS
jgi:hypothetical protein